MKLFSSYEEDLSSLIATLGLYFQIRDDYCNLCLGEVSNNIWNIPDIDILVDGKYKIT